MLSLGGVVLNDSMVWTNRHESQSVSMNTKRLLGGGLAIFTGRLTSGQSVILEANESAGWLTLAQVAQLENMADNLDTIYTLLVNSENHQVIFDHTAPPALSMRPLIARLNEESTDYFIGTIKLLKV